LTPGLPQRLWITGVTGVRGQGGDVVQTGVRTQIRDTRAERGVGPEGAEEAVSDLDHAPMKTASRRRIKRSIERRRLRVRAKTP